MEIPANLYPQVLEFTLSNFGVSMLIIAAFFMLLHRLVTRRVSGAEIVYRWLALFVVGFTGIYAFVMHVFYPEISAQTIGWSVSPFQYEVGIADLGFGLIAVLSFNASFGFRLATVIGNVIWMWGDAIGHIYQMIIAHNYAIGNAGSWFWLDVLIPFFLILCIQRLSKGP